MTKQEEIRRGLAFMLMFGEEPCDTFGFNEMNERNKKEGIEEADQILTYLHSQGVVIKIHHSFTDESSYDSYEPLIWGENENQDKH